MVAVVVATQRAKPGEFFAMQQRRRERNGLGDGWKIKGLNVEYSSSYTHTDVYICAHVPVVHAVTPKTCTSSTVNKVMGRCVCLEGHSRGNYRRKYTKLHKPKGSREGGPTHALPHGFEIAQGLQTTRATMSQQAKRVLQKTQLALTYRETMTPTPWFSWRWLRAIVRHLWLSCQWRAI